MYLSDSDTLLYGFVLWKKTKQKKKDKAVGRDLESSIGLQIVCSNVVEDLMYVSDFTAV